MTNHNEIMEIWNTIEESEPDISTERLIAMTADMAGVDYADVIEALAVSAETHCNGGDDEETE